MAAGLAQLGIESYCSRMTLILSAVTEDFMDGNQAALQEGLELGSAPLGIMRDAAGHRQHR